MIQIWSKAKLDRFWEYLQLPTKYHWNNMKRIHPELYMLYSGHKKMCHILAVLLQSHSWITLKI